MPSGWPNTGQEVALSGKFAKDTTVGTDQSRVEIERTLKRYGADAFAYASEPGRAAVMFRINGRQVRLKIGLPDPAADEFHTYYRGATKWRRAAGVPEQLYEQATRQIWRALALVVKAKLEAVAAGITTVEDEFLAQTVMADGSTVSENIQPQITKHYAHGGPSTLMLEAPK